ncbi:MAG TPA: hypothetical protein VJW76_01470 [Verrucomicrobiae bacterium]|nr:hypothetical protein [Verrucomicrobiae bacterium]
MHNALGLVDPAATAAPATMFAAFDAFWIFVAIAIGSAIFEWLKKKGRQPDADEWPGQEQPHGSPDRPSRPTAPLPKAGDWEAELRRLLGEAPAPTPPPTAPPPRHVPAPPPVSTPRPFVAPAPPPIVQRTMPAPVPIPVARPPLEPEEEELPMRLTKLDLSRAAYERASQLHESVADHLRQIDERTGRRRVETSTARRESASPDAVRAISLVRNPHTVRQAVIASLIFGRPKALESE